MVDIIKSAVKGQDTQTLLDCFSIMNGTKMKEHERMTFAVITDELESRGAVKYDEEQGKYSVCA